MVMKKSPARWIVPLLLLVALVVAIWYIPSSPDIETTTTETGAERPDIEVPSGPRYPLPAAQPESDTPKTLIPLPPLDDSDSYFELALEDLFGNDVGELLVDKALIEKLVATIDNLPRSHVAERIRPAGAPPGELEVVAVGQDGVFILGPENYVRYDGIANRLTDANIENVVETYRRFYPLLQEAYVNLGYPDGYFNDRLVEVIDHLLASPTPAQPITLERPHVLYRFADPELEALSSGHKLMIRIGVDNAKRVNDFLEQIRPRIADSD